jgi:hypothetical protein
VGRPQCVSASSAKARWYGAPYVPALSASSRFRCCQSTLISPMARSHACRGPASPGPHPRRYESGLTIPAQVARLRWSVDHWLCRMRLLGAEVLEQFAHWWGQHTGQLQDVPLAAGYQAVHHSQHLAQEQQA